MLGGVIDKRCTCMVAIVILDAYMCVGCVKCV